MLIKSVRLKEERLINSCKASMKYRGVMPKVIPKFRSNFL